MQNFSNFNSPNCKSTKCLCYGTILSTVTISYNKIEEIGREEINLHGIYIKFDCTPYEIIIPEKKPIGKYV